MPRIVRKRNRKCKACVRNKPRTAKQSFFKHARNRLSLIHSQNNSQILAFMQQTEKNTIAEGHIKRKSVSDNLSPDRTSKIKTNKHRRATRYECEIMRSKRRKSTRITFVRKIKIGHNCFLQIRPIRISV